MSVWTLKMNFIDKPNSFQYCVEHNYIGFGWGIYKDEKGNEKEIKSISEYKTLRSNLNKYEGESQLTRLIDAFESMKDGDYIWTLDVNRNAYYLCEVTGEYLHLSESIGKEYGIANCMKVYKFNPIESSNLIPSDVKRFLNSSGIIYHVRDKHQEKATIFLNEVIQALNK